MMDGLSPVAPISSFLLVRLLPSRAASGVLLLDHAEKAVSLIAVAAATIFLFTGQMF